MAVEYLLVAQAVVFVAALTFFVWDAGRDRDKDRGAQEAERATFAAERAVLLDRIQHPERPARSATGRTTHHDLSPETRKGLREVGTVAPQDVTDGG
jgi:hypothetical protein